VRVSPEYEVDRPLRYIDASFQLAARTVDQDLSRRHVHIAVHILSHALSAGLGKQLGFLNGACSRKRNLECLFFIFIVNVNRKPSPDLRQPSAVHKAHRLRPVKS
jgi:hypothetical protein